MTFYRAVVLESVGGPLVIQERPVPEAVPGSAVVKILATQVSPKAKRVFNGEWDLPLATPTTPSAAAIGRVYSVGPDAVTLNPGHLVLYDFYVAARDDPRSTILQGYMGFQPRLDSFWSHGTYAEYACVPLERCWVLNESLVTQTLGYSYADLAFLGTLAIAIGGLCEIDVQPGDSLIVAPATGYFGGAAVHAGIALGARVIAAGRNETTLSKMEAIFKSTARLKTVKMTGQVETDTKALVDAADSKHGADKYVDFSPPQSAGSRHMESCLLALRPFGRCVMMGAVFQNVELPYGAIVQKSLRIQGRFMFDTEHAERTIKLLEAGLLKLGVGDCSGIQVQSFGLDHVQEALQRAEIDGGWGNMIVLEP